MCVTDLVGSVVGTNNLDKGHKERVKLNDLPRPGRLLALVNYSGPVVLISGDVNVVGIGPVIAIPQ